MLAVDIDGTLLRSDFSISKRTRRAIAAAQERGIVVVIATGRRPATAGRFAAEIGAAQAPLLTLDGALTLDAERRPIAAVPLPKDVVEHAVRVSVGAGATAVALTQDGHYIFGRLLPRRPLRRIWRRRVFRWNGLRHLMWDMTLRPTPCSDPEVLRAMQVLKVNVFGPGEEETRRRLEDDLEGDAWFTMPFGQGTEIVAPGVNKGFGLRVLAGHLGVGIEEMMAVGDNFNDVAMLRLSGCAYLMGNAPRTLTLPVRRAPPTDRDGLAHAIEEALLGGH